MKEKKITRGAYARIHSSYSMLLPAEKQIADFILKNAGKIEELSISELAAYAKTSKSTVTRFCQRLGYDGFRQFRLSAVKDTATGLNYAMRKPSQDLSVEEQIQEICRSNARACMDTPLLLDAKSLENAAHTLLKANRVLLIGDGPVTPIAIDLYQKLLRLGLLCIHSSERRFQQMQSVLVNNEDALIAFDLSGATRSTIQAVKSARSKGCKIIVISNTVGSPISKEADIPLLVPEDFHHLYLPGQTYSIVYKEHKQIRSCLQSQKDYLCLKFQRSHQLNSR
jgi:DNA-binding MurR/RpiR family transcriptional regulator